MLHVMQRWVRQRLMRLDVHSLQADFADGLLHVPEICHSSNVWAFVCVFVQRSHLDHLCQVRMTVVLDHVLDTVQHLLKKKVALERAVDPDTPDIIADGSRIVQVSPCFFVLNLALIGNNSKLRAQSCATCAAMSRRFLKHGFHRRACSVPEMITPPQQD